MRFKTIISFLFIILLFAGCKKDESPTQPVSNPYAGNWRIAFAGDYIGGGSMPIGSDGKFAVTATLQGSSGTFTNVISGSVSSSGSMSADISYAGSKIGTASGTISGNAGSGTYQTSQPSHGTWAATKQ